MELSGDKKRDRTEYALYRMTLAVDRMNETPYLEEWELALRWATAWGIAGRQEKSPRHGQAGRRNHHFEEAAEVKPAKCSAIPQ